ncbi:hypothetical protein PoB_003301500 [Plakobranchus ocellatus]|uniref:Uncharacterized protein n=1 Tax=Plakobranchus ocellatus TaxID=259542 RepID=A0AAV4AI92_9GAST|nr:hypothetical protein PoB_003301500 [Plakobranchus ocellatus]
MTWRSSIDLDIYLEMQMYCPADECPICDSSSRLTSPLWRVQILPADAAMLRSFHQMGRMLPSPVADGESASPVLDARYKYTSIKAKTSEAVCSRVLKYKLVPYDTISLFTKRAEGIC